MGENTEERIIWKDKKKITKQKRKEKETVMLGRRGKAWVIRDAFEMMLVWELLG